MTNYLKKLLLSFVLGAACVTPALAAQKVSVDLGGSIVEYIEKYTELRQNEGKLKIDGTCISACTLFLGLMPQESVCATPFGLLGFHSASTYDRATGEREHSPSGTRLIWNYYPKTVRSALIAKGWDVNNPVAPSLEDHNDVIYFPATDFVKPCGPDNG